MPRGLNRIATVLASLETVELLSASYNYCRPCLTARTPTAVVDFSRAGLVCDDVTALTAVARHHARCSTRFPRALFSTTFLPCHSLLCSAWYVLCTHLHVLACGASFICGRALPMPGHQALPCRCPRGLLGLLRSGWILSDSHSLLLLFLLLSLCAVWVRLRSMSGCVADVALVPSSLLIVSVPLPHPSPGLLSPFSLHVLSHARPTPRQ